MRRLNHDQAGKGGLGCAWGEVWRICLQQQTRKRDSPRALVNVNCLGESNKGSDSNLASRVGGKPSVSIVSFTNPLPASSGLVKLTSVSRNPVSIETVPMNGEISWNPALLQDFVAVFFSQVPLPSPRPAVTSYVEN